MWNDRHAIPAPPHYCIRSQKLSMSSKEQLPGQVKENISRRIRVVNGGRTRGPRPTILTGPKIINFIIAYCSDSQTSVFSYRKQNISNLALDLLLCTRLITFISNGNSEIVKFKKIQPGPQ